MRRCVTSWNITKPLAHQSSRLRSSLLRQWSLHDETLTARACRRSADIVTSHLDQLWCSLSGCSHHSRLRWLHDCCRCNAQGVRFGFSGDSPTSNASSPSTDKSSQTTSLPHPTQTGIDAKCNRFNIPTAGDWCGKFASDNVISADQLYAWNHILAKHGENCNTQFQAGYEYCIGIDGGGARSSSATTSRQPGVA